MKDLIKITALKVGSRLDLLEKQGANTRIEEILTTLWKERNTPKADFMLNKSTDKQWAKFVDNVLRKA